MWNKAFWICLTDPNKLKTKYNDVLKKSGFRILNFVEHHFSPMGYTCLYLLGESHLAIHTFPEENKSYIELSSCNETYFNKFLYLEKLLCMQQIKKYMDVKKEELIVLAAYKKYNISFDTTADAVAYILKDMQQQGL